MAVVEAAPHTQEGRGVMRTAALSLGTVLVLSAASDPARAEEASPSVGVAYVTDILANVSGGERRGVGWLGRADLTVELPGSILGLEAAQFFADLMLLHGTSFSRRLAGDGQVVSNIDAPSAVRPIEIWASLELARGNRLKLGAIDLNSEFDVQAVGRHFINSSHGIGPDFSQSGRNGPSIFPITSLGAVVEHAGDDHELRFGIFDALPGASSDPGRFVLRAPGKHGALLVGETQLNFAENARARLGAWHYSKSFERLDPGNPGRARSSGLYLMAEGRLLETDGRALDGWVRLGTATDETNPISASLGTGLTLGNDDQKIGLAISHARLGDPGAAQFRAEGLDPARAETAFELTYSAQATDQLKLQPNLQYVVSPGWSRDRRNALVMGLRVAFEWNLH